MSDTPRRRRPRTVFHYKVDAALSPEHRDDYLALLRAPRTTIDTAHAWLSERGYRLSRSAIARHRRRLLSRDAEHQAAVARALAFARVAGSPSAPDFAAGAEAWWQQLVFDRLLAAAGSADAGAPAPLTPAELLELGKLMAHSVELTRQRLAGRSGPESTLQPRGRPK